jgi:PRTRC genetic system protein F
MAAAHALTFQHWNAKPEAGAAILAALTDLTRKARPATGTIAHLDLKVVSDWDQESDSYREPVEEYMHRHGHRNVSRVHAFVLTTGASEPRIAVMGPVLDRLEAAHARAGQTVLHILDAGLQACVRALTPVSGVGWCGTAYWRCEANENELVEELMLELSEQHHATKTEAERRQIVLDEYEIFTRQQYDGHFPAWALQPVTTTLPAQLTGLTLTEQVMWEQLRTGVQHLDQLTRQRPEHLNDLSIAMDGAWEVCPFLLRWREDDCLTRVWDDVLNQYYEGGEVDLGMNAVFAFHDAPSLDRALRHLAYYLRLTAACEAVLNSLHTLHPQLLD